MGEGTLARGALHYCRLLQFVLGAGLGLDELVQRV